MSSNPCAATLDAAWDILQHYPELGWSKTSLQNYLIFTNEHALAVFSKVLDEAELLLIATHPDYLQQGYACALLESSLMTLGVQKVFLEVRASNEAAQKLYQKLGFQQFGCRKQYYQEPREDAVLLQKLLS